MIPDGGMRDDFQEALSPVVPGDNYPGPWGVWPLEPLLQGG